MPLTRVVENFDPRSSVFDVLIIDEASQSDAFALLALSMARKVVVVGDHEQVSPSAIGQGLSMVQKLIDTHLDGIPNSHLYDGRTSIYDLARQAFAGMVCLKEHFRCVREIIAFSNNLSYNGEIKPLRDETLVQLRPHLIAYRVNDTAQIEGKINREEAAFVAALVVAATDDPAYEGKTFGVISLLGDDQAVEIERILRARLRPEEYSDRRILCGSAAHFQGDERDVMLLSIVNATGDGPLRLLDQDDAKRRFNVAASRARDQMWVIHSLDPCLDLKPGDLRRRLIEHAQDPSALARSLDGVLGRTESVFEQQVAARLIRLGYRVHPQWKVGAYRIDLVVEESGKRLAIECDGDRFHPPEQLKEDLERQAILERLGWTFSRIRGSQFFRDPELAMGPVFERLNELGIGPASAAEATGPPASGDTEQRDRVIRRAHDLLTEWSEEYQEDVDNEDDDVADDAKTPPAAGQEDDYIRAVIAVLRVAEPLGKRAILEQAVIPESRWPRVIKLLKSRGMIEQSGNRSSTTYRLVNGEV
jgi:very-short-patch-repair endonuclease